MPYIITTGPDGFDRKYHTRRAVATLDEAREAAYNVMLQQSMRTPWPRGSNAENWDAVSTLPAEGGTIGPLPDGTVIEVAPFQPNVPAWRAEQIVDAYNARVTA